MSNWKQGYIPPPQPQTPPPPAGQAYPQQPYQQPHQQQQPYQQQPYQQQPYQQQPYQQQPYAPERPAARPRRSIPLLVSLLLGLAFTIFLMTTTFSHTDKALSQTAADAGELGAQLGTLIGAALLLPQMVVSGVAVILNGVGWGIRSRGFSLAGAILYCVAAVLMIINAPFLLPSIVLSFVGYARLEKKK